MRTFSLSRKKKAMHFKHGCYLRIEPIQAGEYNPSQAANGLLLGMRFN